MDADTVRTWQMALDGQSLATLLALDEVLQQQITAAQLQTLLEWRAEGWVPNAPGLVCHVCGAATYGQQRGHVELVRCTDLLCGAQRSILVG